MRPRGPGYAAGILREAAEHGLSEPACADTDAKTIIDDWCQAVGLDQLLHQAVRTMLVYGFSPVKRWVQSDWTHKKGNLQLKPLPPKTVWIRVNAKGELLGYRQRLGLGAKDEDFTPGEIVWFAWDRLGASPYGCSKIAPLLALLAAKAQVNEDMPKIIHRYAAPLTVWKAKQSIVALKKAVSEREPDEDVFLGNIEPSDVEHTTIEVDARARFTEYIQMVDDQILEGLEAPLLHYLRNATEASATKMLDVIERHIQGIQRYVKRIVERQMFEVVLTYHGKTRPEQVPRIQWGAQKTGVEDLDLNGLANLVSSGAVSSVQAQGILKLMGLPIAGHPHPAPLPATSTRK